jgi:hypothetical protein
MHELARRLARLEHRAEPSPSGWCCTITDPQNLDALPPTCPHGGRWLVLFTCPSEYARAVARQPRDSRRWFTVRIDRPNAREDCDA